MSKDKNKDNHSDLPEALIKIKADQIKQDKCSQGIAIWQQNQDDNLLEAKTYLQSHPLEVFKWRLNQRLIFLEKNRLEPLDDWIKRSAIFSIIEQVSPVIEALGVILGAILIPITIVFISEQAEVNREIRASQIRQQEAIKGYFSQLTEIFLNGDIRKGEKSEDLRRAIEANTLVVLKGPNLDSNGKGEIITFLSKLNLITDTNLSDKQESLISLSKADLSKANLVEVNLIGANLIGANLIGANLSGANLVESNLYEANLSRANLSRTSFVQADLSGADLSGANLSGANLFGAKLFGADLSGANLSGADLSRANLYQTKSLNTQQLKSAENWENAIYTEAEFNFIRGEWTPKDKQANEAKIQEIRESN